MSDEHVPELEHDESHQQDSDGCVTRCLFEGKGARRVYKFPSHDHKKMGFDYQVSHGEDAWYNLPIHQQGSSARKRFQAIFTTPFAHAWRDPSKRAEVWYMNAGPYKDLNFKGSYMWPWGNNAHHVIPVDDALSKVFKYDHLKILQQAKYNVNAGGNILYLPTSPRHGELFQLLTHPKYHSTYSMEVRTRLKSIKHRLDEAADPEKKDHPDVTQKTIANIVTQLNTFSATMRKEIREAGVLKPGAHLNELANILAPR
ncbi:AHH domain-containing protein [Myxococcus qinghaiensis]|uniref:AHH domain-containing protein n=1 Tax=Myxococcus qinghaiensis TaxID=2906758 RepID=UPI0020A7FE89|nr:AHH domain-containing protein [Myxococcus qinghaiensis]MCP3168886.1 AHH domain-containing protein [Myxococcus qinghaiensis]